MKTKKTKAKKHKKTLTLCSSAAFYKQLMEAKKLLEKRGFKVLVPISATQMQRENNFNVASHKTWYKNPNDYTRKNFLTRHHFKKIAVGDAVLVLNYEKKGIDGYIGGAVLMEMGLACHLGKPIYILNPITKGIAFEEEVYGMRPTFLGGDLSRIPR